MQANVLVGISGGIAAFKAIDVVRLLQREGLTVRCALTRAAHSFVAPLTLEILTGHPVYGEEYLSPGGGTSGGPDAGDVGAEDTAPGGRGRSPRRVEEHIDLAAWADLLVIVPATANTLARCSLGLAEDFLSTVALGFGGPVVLAPAMHEVMWHHEAVCENVARLRRRGVSFVGPVRGALASGETGMGRLAEPEEIVRAVMAGLRQGRSLQGVRCLVSAGPTREALDPVRFLSNRSSGKMGFALAAEAARRGAEVTLVAGPVALETPPGVERVDVVSAIEMRDAVLAAAIGADLAVLTAAVADFRPATVAEQKIKKVDGPLAIDWQRNPDILQELAETFEGVLVGFAAETERLHDEAQRKLESKKLDFLVANDVSRAEIGFASDENEVTVFRRGDETIALPQQEKTVLAGNLLNLFAERLTDRDTASLSELSEAVAPLSESVE